MKVFLLIISIILLWNMASVVCVCKDWTLCQRVRCKAPPEKCPEGQYLVWDDCGCCQYCSEEPKTGLCGTCGKDVVCKEREPICNHGIVTIDYCGCCRACRSVLGEGESCIVEGEGPNFSVCDKGLKCIKGQCTAP
ncbi:uncharacterized protein LOC115891885 [Sitophilus oryzae]|uniref:Uncharacterized protein LOC115891885 n=1 Tax=Sitophilus oryzae TaxID=7048 RepID=A0A6J2YZV2_SITOR|nr:uncharacterized protein LOC115891885 [Sitophilus oryzae]